MNVINKIIINKNSISNGRSRYVAFTQIYKMYIILDKNECETDPCSYGSCIDKVNDYSCECNVFFHGRNCSKSMY